MDIKISLQEITDTQILSLKAGDNLLLSGILYTARDAAHKRMCEDFENGKGFPFDIKGQAIYYAGPCPAKPGEVIGSCGPTTSGRMDAYSPLLLDNGRRLRRAYCRLHKKGGDNSLSRLRHRGNKAAFCGGFSGLGAFGRVRKRFL